MKTVYPSEPTQSYEEWIDWIKKSLKDGRFKK